MDNSKLKSIKNFINTSYYKPMIGGAGGLARTPSIGIDVPYDEIYSSISGIRPEEGDTFSFEIYDRSRSTNRI